MKPEMFSVALLGNVFGQLSRRYRDGMDVSIAVLEDLSGEEVSHVTGVFQRNQGPISEVAFADCIRIIRSEHQAAGVTSADDLLAYQNKLRERKGIK